MTSYLDLWPMAVALFGGFAWLIRLEAKVNDHAARLPKVEGRADTLERTIANELSDMKQRLVRIETLLAERR